LESTEVDVSDPNFNQIH